MNSKNDPKQFIQGLAAYFGNLEKALTSEASASGSGWSLDLDSTKLTASAFGKTSESLTAKEFQIVTLLNSSQGKTMTREGMLSAVWGSVKVNAKTVNVHVFNLRKKLLPLGVIVEFVNPGSFRLVAVDQQILSSDRDQSV